MNISTIKTDDVIYISAADSSENDKSISDYICNGNDDQDVIQKAIDSIAVEKCGEIRGVRIVLLPGNYYISAFPRRDQNGHVAIMTGAVTNSFEHIGILISGSEHTESTALYITKECYDSLDAGESYSIFGCAAHNWNHHVFKDLYVTVPDSQKNIICFDGRNMGAVGYRRCKCICKTKGDYGRVTPKLPVEGFIAFMGTYGSNNMWEEKWEFCQAEGFGQGFCVGSEHLLMHKCAALFGRYGFTFNNYFCDFGAVVHSITLLNCVDEANANLWKLGKNKYKQCINAYNISLEVVPAWFRLGGDFAREENPGDYVGHIDFVGNQGFYTQNDPSLKFWEEGSGINFETVNNTHKKVCTTRERLGYAANHGQELFDTDLNKKVIFTGKKWVDCMGNNAD